MENTVGGLDPAYTKNDEYNIVLSAVVRVSVRMLILATPSSHEEVPFADDLLIQVPSERRDRRLARVDPLGGESLLASCTFAVFMRNYR